MAAFPEIEKIRFEGPKSKNLLSFRHYDENEVVEGKSMREHFRFAVAYWHTFRGTGSDPFGPGTMQRPWEGPQDNVENAVNRVKVAFEFMEKLGVPYYCFHDRDVAPEGVDLRQTNANFDKVAKALKDEQQRTFLNGRVRCVEPEDSVSFPTPHSGRKWLVPDKCLDRRCRVRLIRNRA